jgi:hypothetical protein
LFVPLQRGVAPWLAFVTLTHAAAAAADTHARTVAQSRAFITWAAAADASLALRRERHTAACLHITAAARDRTLRRVVAAWAQLLAAVTGVGLADTTFHSRYIVIKNVCLTCQACI